MSYVYRDMSVPSVRGSATHIKSLECPNVRELRVSYVEGHECCVHNVRRELCHITTDRSVLFEEKALSSLFLGIPSLHVDL